MAARSRSGLARPVSCRELEPDGSAGEREPGCARLDGRRSLIDFDNRTRTEDIERITARRVHVTDENRAHELVVAIAEKRALGFERDFREQCVSLERHSPQSDIELMTEK